VRREVNETNVAIAIIGAIGVFFILAGIIPPLFGLLRGALRRTSGLRPRERSVTLLENRPLLDRALGPLLEDASRFLRGRLDRVEEMPGDEPTSPPVRVSAIERRLAQAGYPEPYRTVNDFYAAKVLMAGLFFVSGIAFVVIVGIYELLPLALLLALGGFFLPDMQLKGTARQRRDELILEMSFILDRLAILARSGFSLQQAVATLAQTEGGGWFTQEIRKVNAERAAGVPVTEAFLNAARRNSLDELTRFAGRLRMTETYGTPLADSLRLMAGLMRERLQAQLLERGKRTPVFMAAVVGGLIIPAIFIAVLAPAVILFIRNLSF